MTWDFAKHILLPFISILDFFFVSCVLTMLICFEVGYNFLTKYAFTLFGRMGAGRKTESVVLQNKPPPQQTINHHPWSARGLLKKDLAAVIFGCKYSTMNECHLKLLFG